MSEQFFDKLKSHAGRPTRSTALLVNYFQRHFDDLPFETARSIAQKLNISEMTVGRFLKRLGYNGLKSLKSDLRRNPLSSAWRTAESSAELQRGLKNGELLADLLHQQILALTQVYELAKSEDWQMSVRLLINAKRISVASFQNIGGLARTFAAQLSYAREGVSYLDGGDGTYADLLAGRSTGKCLVLMDCRRYASATLTVAQQAYKKGVPIILIVDEYCTWAPDVLRPRLVIPSARLPTWDSSMPIAALLDLLVTNVVVDLGERSKNRTERIADLQDIFGQFAAPIDRRNW